MAVRDNLTKVLKDRILPELQGIRAEVSKLGSRLDVVESRLADFSARFQAIDQHLVDQSRRIDELRMEVLARIDQQNLPIDQLMAQQATILHEVAALRQDREVGDAPTSTSTAALIYLTAERSRSRSRLTCA